MDDLLTPVSTTYLRSRSQHDDEPLLSEVKPSKKLDNPSRPAKISSVDEALDTLKSQPDYDSLILALRFLVPPSKSSGDFHIHTPSPKSAAVVQTLVTEIAPNYWVLLSGRDASNEAHGNAGDLNLFIESLRSVTGVNAVVSHIRALTREERTASKESKRPDIPMYLTIFLDLLSAILKGDRTIRNLWTASTTELPTQALKKVQSHALLSVLTSGKLISATGEAAEIVGTHDLRDDFEWVADGLRMSRWLGQNIASWAQSEPTDSERSFCADLFQRAISLGYPGKLFSRNIRICAFLTAPKIP